MQSFLRSMVDGSKIKDSGLNSVLKYKFFKAFIISFMNKVRISEILYLGRPTFMIYIYKCRQLFQTICKSFSHKL